MKLTSLYRQTRLISTLRPRYAMNLKEEDSLLFAINYGAQRAARLLSFDTVWDDRNELLMSRELLGEIK